MITLTTATQQALARIAAAPATSEQGRRCPVPLSTRLAHAACPMAVLRPCSIPCQDCTTFAARVALELLHVVQEQRTDPEH